MKKEIDWSKELNNARRQLHRNKAAIEATPMGTPASWSRPDYDKPLIAPDPTAPETKIVGRRLNKKQRRAHNKVFVPQQKAKSKRDSETGGLPVAKK
jgi:hypothetical protein